MSSGERRHRLEWDEGVASERTVLAWERTAVASLAVAALIVRAGIVYHLLGLALPLAALLAGAGVVEWLFSRRLEAEHDRPLEHGAVVHSRMLTTLAVVTLAGAIGGAVLGAIR